MIEQISRLPSIIGIDHSELEYNIIIIEPHQSFTHAPKTGYMSCFPQSCFSPALNITTPNPASAPAFFLLPRHGCPLSCCYPSRAPPQVLIPRLEPQVLPVRGFF